VTANHSKPTKRAIKRGEQKGDLSPYRLVTKRITSLKERQGRRAKEGWVKADLEFRGGRDGGAEGVAESGRELEVFEVEGNVAEGETGGDGCRVMGDQREAFSRRTITTASSEVKRGWEQMEKNGAKGKQRKEVKNGRRGRKGGKGFGDRPGQTWGRSLKEKKTGEKERARGGGAKEASCEGAFSKRGVNGSVPTT